MQTEHFRHRADDGVEFDVYCWLPDAEPARVMQIVHGMSEHAGRYARFARALTDAGYAVFAQDLRGHGPGAAVQGHFADQDGWRTIVADVVAVHDHIGARYPEARHVLFGHSMGSFVVQDCLARFGNQLQAAILSATDKPPTLLRQAGLLLARFEQRRLGPRAASALIQRLSFGEFNRPFDRPGAPARTDFDWLSSDADEVNAYIEDPYCGFACSTASWVELLAAIGRVQAPSRRRKIPRRLPVLLIAGDEDPVARRGKGPHTLARLYRQDGMHDVSTRLYADGRHELLNERMREAVISDLLNWLDARLCE